MPGLNTLKTLEERQTYLIKKIQNNPENNDKSVHILNEIRALEKTMNFIKWIINNASNDVVQGTIERYKDKDTHDEEETMDEDIEKEKGIFKGILQEKYSFKRKLEITITEYNEENYIFLEEMRLKQDMVTWKKIAKIRMTLHKMEKILKRVYETLDGGQSDIITKSPCSNLLSAFPGTRP